MNRFLIGLAALWIVACSLEQQEPSAAAPPVLPPPVSSEPPAAMPPDPVHAPPQLGMPELCMRDGNDAVRDVFCTDAPPAIRSFEDLQAQLEAARLAYENSVEGSAGVNGLRAVSTTALLGHSTALSGHLVSPINPRLIIVRNGLILTFQRGVQRVELVAGERGGARLNFYLLEFAQACNEREGGCLPGDLFTPAIESDWTRVVLRDDEDLKNTPSDCRQCHQRGTATSRLLMRELQSPWTHFFYPAGADGRPTVGGGDLAQDYVDAKGDELYGGFGIDLIAAMSVFLLEGAVGDDQPLLFDAPQIESERWPVSADGTYPSEPQPSPTWERGYEAFKRGEQLALPYVDLRVTDLTKQRAISDAYRRYRIGELSPSELPDLSDVFPDDPAVRARIGLQNEPGASAEDALIQTCASCHNDVLDQTISRARFSVSVRRLDRAALDRAIARLTLPRGAPGVMPPPEARQLDDRARDELIAYLRAAPADLDPAGRLERVAQLGMAGGARDPRTGQTSPSP